MKKLLILAVLCIDWRSLPAERPVARIPALRGETFAGETVSLPDSLHGRPGLLVIGFSQGSRGAVTQWGTWLANGKTAPKIPYYEMPVLASVPRLLRGFVTGRIKAAVADPAKPHFLPLLDHENEWRDAAQYGAPDEAYVLLIDGEGYVRWRTHGPPNDVALAGLTQGLATVHGREASPSRGLLSK